jgi:hypothetical protein
LSAIERVINPSEIDHEMSEDIELLSQEGARLLVKLEPGTSMGRMRPSLVDEWPSCFARIITSLLTATARAREGAAAEVPHLPAGPA